jgi:glycosyltransferase involved in cell wall biosynthesis
MPGSMPFDLRLNIWMERTAIRTADSLIAPSNDIAKVIENGCNLPSKCVHVIPDALDIDLWDDSDREHTNQDDVITILHVGRLEQVKGIEVLVKAIPSVLRQIPKARFVFIGAARSDQQASYWQEKLKNVGGEHILIMGFLEQTELAYWYHQSDIAVVPSLNYESFSYTCAQAMAAGLPVVASRIGGIPETVDDRKSGILFEPGDIESLGKAIIALAKDKDLRIHMGRVAREKAKRTFSALDCAKNSVELFSTILKS